MRIAIVTWNRRMIGGVETYLSQVIPELHRTGHSVSLLHEVNEPSDREQIALPDEAQSWSVADIGVERALAELRDWRPDLIYAHGLHDADLEKRVVEIAPEVFFAHAYYGTCISGGKAFKSPTVTPCSRRFGWKCLLHYYPRRCGGLSPVTMIRQYGVQSRRLERLRHCNAIVTSSEHMRYEYLKHGIKQDRIFKISLPIILTPPQVSCSIKSPRLCPSRSYELEVNNFDHPPTETAEWRLLFLGRMDLLKGGQVFLDALPQVAASTDRSLRVTFAGDGPDREALESKAARIRSKNQRMTIEFTGWMQRSEFASLFESCDLLVIPSLWPEPFGLAGLEAGLHGVPSVAFEVGGISDWLIDGINGHLAPGKPPTAGGLAEAILKCLGDRDIHSQLRQGAVNMALRFSLQRHMSVLLRIFKDNAS